MKNYKKNKEFLICIDSDGCVMDTMNSKHYTCFGPQLIEIFDLHHHNDYILSYWNELNLYSKTRGINRFVGLYTTLEKLHKEKIIKDDLSDLKMYVEESESLSNDSLIKLLEVKDSAILKKALAWSHAVNSCIVQLPKGNDIFKESTESLIAAHELADVVVVSAANKEALIEEWNRLDVAKYTNMIFGQDYGSKSEIIRDLKLKGYKEENILMIGDALGDLKAARDNDVYFYPIIVNEEKESWIEFRENVLSSFVENKNFKEIEDKYIKRMKTVLK